MHATVPVADRDQLCVIKTGPRGKDRRYYKLSGKYEDVNCWSPSRIDNCSDQGKKTWEANTVSIYFWRTKVDLYRRRDVPLNDQYRAEISTKVWKNPQRLDFLRY